MSPSKRAPQKKRPASVVVATASAPLAARFSKAVSGAVVARTAAALEAAAVAGARVAFVDARLLGAATYETLRRLRVRTRARLVLMRADAPSLPEGALAIAKFVGAETILGLEPSSAEIRACVSPAPARSPADLLADRATKADSGASFRDRVLRELARPHDPALLDAISDPETRLYSSTYGTFALDQEFKRSIRFGLPLSVALVGFEGEASRETLLELAGLFLNEIRDTDTLARFDVSSFLFVLPNTLPEGARTLLERTAEKVAARGLRDLVGDAIALAGGVASASLPDDTREQLFGRASRAYERARNESKSAVVV